MRKWLPVLVLAAAQFVMVLDTTVMNVAISDVVADLDTTVSQVQLAITLYTLVMAGLMLTGGKLGDILGRRRAFAIGLVIYAAGSMTTALSPDVTVLILGWSGLEGIGPPPRCRRSRRRRSRGPRRCSCARSATRSPGSRAPRRSPRGPTSRG